MKNFDWTNEEVKVKSSNFTLSLSHHGEGISGDYDASNPDDRRLLRYDLYHNDDLSEVLRNGSACTELDVSLSEEEAQITLKAVLVKIEDQYQKYGNPNLGTITRMLESLDWTVV